MAQDPFEPYLQQADDLFVAGDVVKAGQIWQAILKRVPQHPEARTGLLRVKTYFGVRATQEEEARNTLSQLPPPQPAPTSAPLLDQGTVLYDAGQVEEALQVWERLLALDPAHVLARGYANMARSLLGMPLLEAPPMEAAPPPVAERSAQQTAPRIGGMTMALPVQARASAPEPLPEPEPELAPDPEDDETLLRNGCLLFDMGQPEDALVRWERLLQRNPSHVQAREYITQVRKQVGLPPLESAPGAPAPEAPRTAPALVEDVSERMDRLVREGVQLFDMGMSSEAIAKWETVLAECPDHPNAQGYIAMANRESVNPTAPPTAPTPPPSLPDPVAPPPPVAEVLPPTRAERRRDIQSAIAQADQLMQLQRFEEAVQLFDRILQVEPGHPEALQRYQSARALAQAAAQPPPEPSAPPEVPEPAPQPAPPIAIPATAVAAPQPRGGLELPEALRRLSIPPWAMAPKVWAMVAGGLLVSLVITMLVNQRIAERKLKVEVESAKREALTQALRATLVPEMSESPDAVLKDAEAQIQTSPLIGYLRAQALMALQPDQPAGPALMERARTLLASSPTPTGTLADVEAKLKAGDYEGSQTLLLALLRHAPDDEALRARTFRLTANLVQLHAMQERWEPAREGLRLMRALAPGDPSLPARMRLLEAIQGMPRKERSSWIPMLG